jgi:hypothetical protein
MRDKLINTGKVEIKIGREAIASFPQSPAQKANL